MSTRNSSYARVDGDTYITPGWVWMGAGQIDPDFLTGYDPALIVRNGYDFLQDQTPREVITSNPPFSLSDEFVSWAINRTKPCFGKVAMLLPHSWDTAGKRTELFKVPFKGKYTLIRRIRWVNLEQKKNGPSTNHAFYIWDWKYRGREPIMGWLK